MQRRSDPNRELLDAAALCRLRGTTGGAERLPRIRNAILALPRPFAATLQVITRKRQRLVAGHARRLGDGKSPLQVLAKNSPTIATDAHISIIGHVTEHEVRRLLTENEMANGFANRFLWIAARTTRPCTASISGSSRPSLSRARPIS
jgi:hypothetical protein